MKTSRFFRSLRKTRAVAQRPLLSSRGVTCILPLLSFLLFGCASRAAALREACNSGNATGCAELGDIYASGSTDATKEGERAAGLYKQACDGGSMFGCYRLAGLYRDGNEVKKDEERAAALYKQVCDRLNSSSTDFIGGCLELGEMYRKGSGVPRDEAQANALFQMACDYTATIRTTDCGVRATTGAALTRQKEQSRLATCVGGRELYSNRSDVRSDGSIFDPHLTLVILCPTGPIYAGRNQAFIVGEFNGRLVGNSIVGAVRNYRAHDGKDFDLR